MASLTRRSPWRLASGEALTQERLRLPSRLRGALCEISWHCVIAPVNVMETVETQAILMANEEWNDLDFEVALDSGAVIHICSPSDCPGYVLEESPGSKRGQVFLPGDGETIPNLGQKSFNLCDDQGNDAQTSSR